MRRLVAILYLLLGLGAAALGVVVLTSGAIFQNVLPGLKSFFGIAAILYGAFRFYIGIRELSRAQRRQLSGSEVPTERKSPL